MPLSDGELEPAPLNQRSADFTLDDLMTATQREVLLQLNCHAIATIQSFDPDDITAQATINYSQTYYKSDNNGEWISYQVPYPILLDCPVVIMSGGGGSLTFPIAKGDECIVLFNDRDIDNWVAGASSGSPVASGRLHSMADGMILVGFPDIESYDMERALLAFNGAMVGVGKDNKVKIANQLYTLNGLLQDLITQIKAITVICAAPASPSSVPVNVAAFTAIATQLQNLLE